jgi:hypothetical protein
MEMPDEDQPSESIWLDPDAITGHFEWLRNKYASKASGDTEAVPDPDSWDQNEVTAGWR